MKKFHVIEIMGQVLLYLGLFSITASLVFGMYGGETYIKTFDKCYTMNITINGSLPLVENEYKILSNCIQTLPHNFRCFCNNDWDFIFKTQPNTLNNYTFTFEYDWFEEKKSSSSRKKRRVVYYIYNWTEPEEEDNINAIINNATAEEGIIKPKGDTNTSKTNQDKTQNQDVRPTSKNPQTSDKIEQNIETNQPVKNISRTQTKETTDDSIIKWWMIPIGIIIIIVIGSSYWIYIMFKEPPKDKTNEIQRALDEIQRRR